MKVGGIRGIIVGRTWLRTMRAAFRCTGIVLLLSTAVSMAEPRFYFEAAQPAQRPIPSSIHALLQDHSGLLWIGTDRGLQRYDGHRYRAPTIARDEQGYVSLLGSVLSLAEDDSHKLWIGSWGDGLWRLDPLSGSLTRPDLTELHDRSIQMLRHIDGEGLWVGANRHLLLIHPEQGHLLKRIELPASAATGVAIIDVIRLDDGGHWIATTQGIYRHFNAAGELKKIKTTNTGLIAAVAPASNGRLMIAAENGLFALDRGDQVNLVWRSDEGGLSAVAESAAGTIWVGLASGGLRIVDVASDPDRSDQADGRLPASIAQFLKVDRSGLLWIGTSTHGLLKVDPSGPRFQLITDHSAESNPISTNNVSSLHEDNQRGLWVGTIGDGLKRRDPVTGSFRRYNNALLRAFAATQPRLPLNVHGIAASQGNRLWVSTDLGVAELDPAADSAVALPALAQDATGRGVNAAGDLLVSRDGSLWTCVSGSGALVARLDAERLSWKPYLLDTPNGRATRCLDLAEDAQGNIWIASPHGAYRINPDSGDMRRFIHEAGDPRSLPSSQVQAIFSDRDGGLWVGSQAGLSKFDDVDANNADFGHWSSPTELRRYAISAIERDDQQRLWLGTDRGLVAYRPDGGEIIDSSARDGRVSTAFRPAAAIRLASGELAFGGLNGINHFQPAQIRASRYVAPVIITDVRIGNRPRFQPGPGAVLRLQYADPVVMLDFAALDYAAPQLNRYWYRLIGHEDEWVDAGTRTSAVYAHLPPGRYTFQVRGSNRDGNFGPEPAQLDIEVLAPWWISAPAKTIYCGLALIALLQGWRVIRNRRAQLARHTLQLEERENRLRMALWGSGDQFWDWDIHRGLLTRTSGEGKRINVIPIDVWQSQIHPDDIESLRQRMIDHIEGRTDTYESEHRLKKGDDWQWVLARGRIVERDSAGKAMRVSGTARDITQSRLAEQDRRIARQVLHNMDEAVTVFDLDFIVTSVNPAFSRMTGWAEHHIIGQSTALLDCSQHDAQHYDSVRHELATRGRWSGELWQRRSDDSQFSSWTQLNEVRDGSGVRTHYVGVVSDITERKRAEQELRYLANYDMLTGLPNRSLLSERLASAIKRNPEQAIGIIYLDLDRFKHVNDSFGHATGDRLLKAAGDRLRSIVERNDTVSRLGGDEFSILLENLSCQAEAESVAQRIVAAFAQPIDLGDAGTVIITPSVGVSLYPEHGGTVAELLKFADTAMYQAKESGRNTFMVYTESMDTAARQRATLIAALRMALERNEFRLVFQPRLSLTHWRLTAVEALLRWHSADLGEVGPSDFIPVAEDTGLIIEIGEWVLRETCAQIARWRNDGIRGLTVSINVSMLQLQRGNVAERLSAMLEEYSIPADQIELELTESVVMANAEQSIGILQQLRDVGVTLSIDDFGTGYSSLSYLKRLPIDTLKIDKAFVGDITTDADDRAITATIIAMAQSLGLNVVAEGVETAAQIEFLREHHCDEIQGYWLSPPLQPDDCHAFLQEHLQRRNRMLGLR